MKEFAAKRPGYVISQITDKFGLNGTSELQVTYDDGSMGNIYLEGVQLPDNNFTGIYFKGIPVECIAVPKKPSTMAKIDKILSEEKKINIKNLVNISVKNLELIYL